MKTCLKFLIVFISFVSTGFVFSSNDNYIIFVDAGSSGSRLHIFQYENTSALPVIRDVFSKNAKPGLSFYAENPTLAGPAFDQMLKEASQFLRDKGVNPKTTPLNIFGTSGMRLLPLDKQNAIYLNVKNYIQTHYTFPIQKIETISGKMEGLYGWLNVNYLLGNFQNSQSTVGAIDMGGASTQIVFATQDEGNDKDTISLKINNQHYTVFSKSFAGFGQDRALAAMMTYKDSSSCFPNDYLFSAELTSFGRFNMVSCKAIYTDMIKNQEISKQIISTQGKSFVAFAGIYYVHNFFDTVETPDEDLVESRIQSTCTKTWEQLKARYPEVPEVLLSTYCANAVYHSALIYDTYKIQGSQLTVINEVNGTELNVALGAALAHVSKN